MGIPLSWLDYYQMESLSYATPLPATESYSQEACQNCLNLAEELSINEHSYSSEAVKEQRQNCGDSEAFNLLQTVEAGAGL